MELLISWIVVPSVVAIFASLRLSAFAAKYLLICLPPTMFLGALGAGAHGRAFH